MPYDGEGRDGDEASISQGMTKTASKPSGPRREAWDRFSLTAFEGTSPGDNLILDF